MSEQALLRSWKVEGAGDFEEFLLENDKGVRAFSSWLHQRPFMMGSWTLKGCQLHIAHPDNDKMSYDYTVLGLAQGRLTLRDADTGDTHTYRQVQ